MIFFLVCVLYYTIDNNLYILTIGHNTNTNMVYKYLHNGGSLNRFSFGILKTYYIIQLLLFPSSCLLVEPLLQYGIFIFKQ